MNLAVDHSAGARAVYVQCIQCRLMLRLCDAQIDRDGPSFRSYYHVDCLPEGQAPVERCGNYGCNCSAFPLN